MHMSPSSARFRMQQVQRARLCCSALVFLLLGGADCAAQRQSSPYTITTQPATATRGPIVSVETQGPVGNRFQAFETADDTTFDFTRVHIAASPNHPMQSPVRIGEQEQPPNGIRITGGVIDSGLPRDWGFDLAHAFGSVGFYTVARGLQAIEGAHIRSVEDGWQPRETPSYKLRAYPNTSHFLMKNCYMTDIRDDCIENDEFLPGVVEDSLFDGVHGFLSEQNERQAGLYRPKVATIGPDEDRNILLTRVLVRLTVTNGNGETGTGKWFKLRGVESPVHHLVITDCVFATDAPPRQGGWGSQRFPEGVTFRGTNYVLWLGEPGVFATPLPRDVVFLEGQAAREKWQQVKNQWLEVHGQPSQADSDRKAMEAPAAASRRRPKL